MSQQQFFNPVEIAELVKVAPQKVRDWIEGGELKASNLGNRTRPRWKVSRENFEAFLESRGNYVRAAKQKQTRRKRRSSSVREVF